MRSPSRRGFSKPPSVSSSAELDGLGFSRAGDRTDQADRHVGFWHTSANRCPDTNDGPPTYYQPIPTDIANGRYGVIVLKTRSLGCRQQYLNQGVLLDSGLLH